MTLLVLQVTLSYFNVGLLSSV